MTVSHFLSVLLLKYTIDLFAVLLNLNHQEEVLEFTWPYRIAWKFIGIELGINPSQLETIEVHNRMRVEDCFVETLQRWLEYCDYKPTWFALNQALQSEPVLDTAGK